MEILNVLVDFENNERFKASIWILVSVLLFFFVIIAILEIIRERKAKNFESTEFKYFNSKYIFVINYRDQVVDYFKISSLRKIKTVSFLDFLNDFDDGEQNNVRTYISALLNITFNPLNEETVLKTKYKFTVNKRKVVCAFLLHATAVDKDKETVYLEGLKLYNLPAENKLFKKFQRHDIYDFSVLKKMYDDGKFNKGSFYVVKIRSKERIITHINEYELRNLLVDVMYKITNNSVSNFCFTTNPTEIVILDSRQFNSYQAYKYSEDLQNRIQMFLEINSLADLYDFSIVNSLCGDLPTFFENSLLCLLDLYKNYYDSSRILSYKPGIINGSYMQSRFKIEVERIITEQAFTALFCPVAHISKTRANIFAYRSIFNFNSEIFENTYQVLEAACEYNLTSELMPIVLRKIIPIFSSQCNNTSTIRLTIPVDLRELKEIPRLISHIPDTENLKFIFLIKSSQLIDYEDKADFMEELKAFKKDEYALGIELGVDDYILQTKTYSIFDYIFFKPLKNETSLSYSREYIELDALVQKLLKPNKSIIAVGGDNLQTIEILFKMGISNFTNDYLSKSDLMLLPLDQKIIKKIINRNM